MDTASDSVGESKPVCQCAPKSGGQRWLPGFLIALCLLMSLSSITVCLLMGFKTFMLENRLQMEMDKASIFHPPHTACLNEDGTLIPELSSSIGKLVEEPVSSRVLTGLSGDPPPTQKAARFLLPHLEKERRKAGFREAHDGAAFCF
ncbi:hypothetical protein EYF80_031332 [Liparis tanakae]|uniref:Uncharacterized protein n=1 Tax=Liparis tanakae TaxID=230148 RepID=A0A4Z2GYR8_9TELE|nr:hypothetical protein EYF80_031332 [Liparis tanakae]